MTRDELEELRSVAKQSTSVVAWYPHPTEVRGPFCRWLTISEVDDKYKHNVASTSDEAEFVAAAMNNLVPLLDHIEKLEKEIIDLTIEEELTGIKND